MSKLRIADATLDANNATHQDYIEAILENAIAEVGYALKPDQLFQSIALRARQGQFILDDLTNTLKAIELSTLGAESEDDFAHLFEDLDLNSTKLGNNANDRNELVSKVISHLENYADSYEEYCLRREIYVNYDIEQPRELAQNCDWNEIDNFLSRYM